MAHAHTELQRTADAVALAAAAKLPNLANAIDAGKSTAGHNDTSIVTTLDENDFEFGWWNRNASTFATPAPVNRPNNAVRVTVSRTEAGGKTIIYATGNVTRNGGTWVNNNTQKAENLQLYMTGGTANFTSDNGFYGVIYAPNTDVTVNGSADFFGAAVGRTLKFSGGGRAHYDESLKLEEVDPPTRTTLVD